MYFYKPLTGRLRMRASIRAPLQEMAGWRRQKHGQKTTDSPWKENKTHPDHSGQECRSSLHQNSMQYQGGRPCTAWLQ